jgi:hypothetical protein
VGGYDDSTTECFECGENVHGLLEVAAVEPGFDGAMGDADADGELAWCGAGEVEHATKVLCELSG